MPYKKTLTSASDFVGKPPVEPAETVTEEKKEVAQPTADVSEVKVSSSPVGSMPVTTMPTNGGGYSPYPNHQGPTEEVSGILDVQPEGHGFLRPKYIPS